MTERAIRELLEQVRSKRLDVDQATERLRHLPFEDLDFAKIDHHRGLRQGMPEVILGKGKRPEQVAAIVKRMLPHSPNILVTRADAAMWKLVRKLTRAAKYHEMSGAIAIHRDKTRLGKGRIVIVSAGTSDAPVAEEARVTAEIMGNEVAHLYDVGVAGIHRLLAGREVFDKARVIIVCA